MDREREVTLFGKLADPLGAMVWVGGGECEELISDIRSRVAALEPRLADLLRDPRVRACIDGTFAKNGARVAPGSTVEFIPVVSGG